MQALVAGLLQEERDEKKMTEGLTPGWKRYEVCLVVDREIRTYALGPRAESVEALATP